MPSYVIFSLYAGDELVYESAFNSVDEANQWYSDHADEYRKEGVMMHYSMSEYKTKESEEKKAPSNHSDGYGLSYEDYQANVWREELDYAEHEASL